MGAVGGVAGGLMVVVGGGVRGRGCGNEAVGRKVEGGFDARKSEQAQRVREHGHGAPVGDELGGVSSLREGVGDGGRGDGGAEANGGGKKRGVKAEERAAVGGGSLGKEADGDVVAERVLHLDADGLEAGGAVAIDEDGAGQCGGDSDDGVGADLFF